MYPKVDLNKDKIIWEGLVVIDANENLSYEPEPSYSSHIVRLYENKYLQRYYLFIQMESNVGEHYKLTVNEMDRNMFRNCWGRFIMNYNKPQYDSLKKYIQLDDATPIYGIILKIGQNFEDSFYIIIPLDYRYM